MLYKITDTVGQRAPILYRGKNLIEAPQKRARQIENGKQSN